MPIVPSADLAHSIRAVLARSSTSSSSTSNQLHLHRGPAPAGPQLFRHNPPALNPARNGTQFPASRGILPVLPTRLDTLEIGENRNSVGYKSVTRGPLAPA